MKISSRNRRTLMGGTYENQDVSGDYRNALSYTSKYNDVIFSNSNFGKSQFPGSSFHECHFTDCNLSLVNFNACTFDDCTFRRCDLDQSTFEGSIIKRTGFFESRAQYSSFYGATLTDVLLDCDLHGADVRFASAVNVSYEESNLWGASFNVSCASFLGHKMSRRQLELFLALLCDTKGNDDLRRKVKSLLSAESVKMMARLTEQ